MLEIRKQISFYVPLSDWKLLQQRAAREKLPVTELIRRWVVPHLADLRRRDDR